MAKKITKHIKKSFSSGIFWGIQAILFGLVLGLPFIVAGNTFLNWWKDANAIEILGLVLLTAIAGFLIEAYVKKAKLI